MNDEEKFFAWLDGELAPAEAAALEAKVAADPELARRAEHHRALGLRLRGAFDPVAAAPVPERLQAALRPTGEVVDFAAVRQVRALRSLPHWAAMAATLALGLLLGTMVSQAPDAPIAVQDGRIYAASSLDQALDTQLASAPAGAVRIGLTFRDTNGEICRSFTHSAASGLACRSNGRWHLKGLFAPPQGQASDYRMAAGMDPNLAALVDATISGEPFDAAAEKAGRDNGWR